MPGVRDAIDCLSIAGYELAVASSSPLQLIQTAMDTFGLTERFSVLHSAEAEKEGKPHPAVYNSAMSRLDAEPQNCIAFEDSVIGVRSAKDAGAWVIAVPDASDIERPEFAMADLVLPSLTDFSLAKLP
jgi:sugar-phosphatase